MCSDWLGSDLRSAYYENTGTCTLKGGYVTLFGIFKAKRCHQLNFKTNGLVLLLNTKVLTLSVSCHLLLQMASLEMDKCRLKLKKLGQFLSFDDMASKISKKIL